MESLAHLKKQDPKLGKLIDEFGEPEIQPQFDYFKALVKSIIYQQLSGKSAFAIYSRFMGLFNSPSPPTPEETLAVEDSQYTSLGLSKQKACYVKEISKAFASGGIVSERLPVMTNDEIREQLIKVKGIGPWTIDMFLMFTLNRPDILPLGDLGIKKGFKVFFNLDNLPDEDFMLKKAKKWRPFRTTASWYLWKLVDDDFQW